MCSGVAKPPSTTKPELGSDTPVGDNRGMNCPNCPATLVEKAPPNPGARCEQCSGVLLDVDAYLKLKPESTSESRKRGVVTPGAAGTRARSPRKCPKCLTAMTPFQYGSLVLDGCRPCRAIWFDAGQLRRAMEMRAAAPVPAAAPTGMGDLLADGAAQAAMELMMEALASFF